MKDEDKTKEQLINELLELRRRVTELEALETERKVAEEALAKERNLLRTLIDNLPDYIYAMDTEGRFVLANITIARYLGAASPDELLGKTNFDFYPPALAARNHALDQEIMQSGQSVVNLEESVIDLAGNPVWFSTNAIPLRDSQGKIRGLVGITQDITERKRAEEEIKNLAKFPSENPNPVLRLSHDGLVLYANEASQALLEDWGCEVGGHAPPFWHDVVTEALTSRTTKTVDIQYGERVCSFFVAPITDAGYVNLYGRDITERKRAEEEREKLITELQGTLAHIKTLSGLLPICASCKKIRDDEGYWHQVEVYIRDHADVEFSHGICPDCLKKLYPDYV